MRGGYKEGFGGKRRRKNGKILNKKKEIKKEGREIVNHERVYGIL